MARILYKIFDYVIRRFNAPSAELKKRTGSSLRHRLARSPDSTGAPSQPKLGRCSKRLVRMVPRSARIWSSQLFTKPTVMYHQIHTYTELQQQIHDDLRIQHPEWVESNGESPMCDSYESRLTELLLAARPLSIFKNA